MCIFSRFRYEIWLRWFHSLHSRMFLEIFSRGFAGAPFFGLPGLLCTKFVRCSHRPACHSSCRPRGRPHPWLGEGETWHDATWDVRNWILNRNIMKALRKPHNVWKENLILHFRGHFTSHQRVEFLMYCGFEIALQFCKATAVCQTSSHRHRKCFSERMKSKMSKHVSITSIVLAWTITMTLANWTVSNFKLQFLLSTMTGQHNVSSLRNLFVAGERCDPETFLGGRQSKRTLKSIIYDTFDWFQGASSLRQPFRLVSTTTGGKLRQDVKFGTHWPAVHVHNSGCRMECRMH